MICPHCNTSFFEEWSRPHALVWNDENVGQGIKYAPCPGCCKLIVRIVEAVVDPYDEGFQVGEDGTISFFSEFTVYPNSSKSELTDEIPEYYRGEVIEAQAVLPVSPKASAAISRRLLQKVLHDELNIKNSNLSKQIDKFLELPDVPSHLSKSVDAIRNIGNFAAHPSKETHTGEVIEVEPGEADWIIEVLLSLFDFVFVQPLRIEQRRKELNEKLKALGKPEMKG